MNYWIIIVLFIISSIYAFYKMKQQRKARAIFWNEVKAKLQMSSIRSVEKLLSDFAFFKNQKPFGKLQGHLGPILQKEGAFGLIHLFEYDYSKNSGESSIQIYRTVIVVELNNLDFPSFRLKPEHFFHRLVDYIYPTDIDFEEDKAFSDKYLLVGREEDAIRAVFNSTIRDLLYFIPELKMESKNGRLLIHTDGNRDLAGVLRFYNKVLKLLEVTLSTSVCHV